MTFHVGQKVVCVDAANTSRLGMTELELGRIYEVEWIGRENPYGKTGFFVRLVGVRRSGPLPLDRPTDPFAAWRFRPVIERKTDISIFTALLNPANHKPLVDA